MMPCIVIIRLKRGRRSLEGPEGQKGQNRDTDVSAAFALRFKVNEMGVLIQSCLLLHAMPFSSYHSTTNTNEIQEKSMKGLVQKSISYCVKEQKPCVGWVNRYFKDCLCNFRDDLSFALGLVSLVCWGVAEIPQIVTNFRTKSSHGISPLFLFTWVAGYVLLSSVLNQTRSSFFTYWWRFSLKRRRSESLKSMPV